MSASILVVYTKPIEGREEEYDEWYSSVHLPDVLRLDGFVAARRYRHVPDRHAPGVPLPWLAIYDIADGMLEQAQRALRFALRASAAAVREGRTPELRSSDALHEERSVAWFVQVAGA